MLIGLSIGRAGALERLVASRPAVLRVIAITSPLAIAFRFVLDGLRSHPAVPAPGFAHRLSLALADDAAAWTLSATYAALLIWAMQDPGRVRALWPLRAVGRMAFTNYLSQATLLVPACLLFGLFDHVSPLGGVWMAVALGALQLWWSPWWLARHAL